MITDNIDNMSWIIGYKSKKDEVSKDYDTLIKHLSDLNLKQSAYEWNIDITTHKIKAKIPSENIGIINQQNDPRNIILKTLSSYTIVYTENEVNLAFIFYMNDEDKNKEFPIRCKK